MPSHFTGGYTDIITCIGKVEVPTFSLYRERETGWELPVQENQLAQRTKNSTPPSGSKLAKIAISRNELSVKFSRPHKCKRALQNIVVVLSYFVAKNREFGERRSVGLRRSVKHVTQRTENRTKVTCIGTCEQERIWLLYQE